MQSEVADLTRIEPAMAFPDGLSKPVYLPHGGSKWAHQYGLPRRAPGRRLQTVLHQQSFCQPDGSVTPGTPDRQEEASPQAAFPLKAGTDISLGHFLTGQLPGILAQRGDWQGGVVAGAAPTPQQSAILARLGLLDGYVALSSPQKFRVAVGQQTQPAHDAPADKAVLALLGRLRAPAATQDLRLAIIPSATREKFCLRNRDSLTTWLRAKRFTVLDIDALAFDDIAAALAAAKILVLADPAQAGLAGLCSPGASIIEIVPEGWARSTARALCDALDLPWSLLFGSAPVYPLLQPLAFGAVVPLSYEIPISQLNKLLVSTGN